MIFNYRLSVTEPRNLGIFASYLAVGFGLYFIQTPITFYMVDDINASAQQQIIVLGLMSLPWALKLVCGFITDSFPIMGKRRKPYFLIGWGLFVLCNITLAIIGKPDIGILALFIFLMTMSFVQADVCTDAMIVERSKAYENNETRGTLQANGYIIRFFGSMVGATAGACLYNKDSWGWGMSIRGIFLINAFVPLFVITPFFYNLVEVDPKEVPNISQQLKSIWALVQRKAVWRPCSFIYIYNMLLLTNPAWNSFLVDGLGFSNFDLGLLTVFGSVLSYFALIIYKKYLFKTSWRLIYLGATFICFVFTLLQLVLVFQWNKAIGCSSRGCELIFAMGSYGVIMFVQSIQFLPACRMFLAMCPGGAEGASYAMLTTLSNLAGVVSYSISAALCDIWNVSNDTLSDHNYGGMWRLTLLCGCLQLTGLFFLPLLPNGIEEQIELQKSDRQSRLAGSIFMFVVGISLIFVVAETLLTIVG